MGMAKRPVNKLGSGHQWWLTTRRFLAIWAVLAVVAGAVAWQLYRVQITANETVMVGAQQQKLRLAAGAIASDLSAVKTDLLYLASQSDLKRWLDRGDDTAWTELAADYVAFAREKGVYDQIRLIDAAGRELVRVNWRDGHPRLVPKDALQKKSRRYYVQRSLHLGVGKVYVSPFDLNVENGKIEQPSKPVIRFATPVFDSAGTLRGIIVLNFLGRRILDHLSAIAHSSVGQLWLLNDRGYWLMGPHSKDEWGFMYPHRTDAVMSQRYPAVWSSLVSGQPPKPQHVNGDLFTYRRVVPTPRLLNAATAPLAGAEGHFHWYLVAFVPATAIAYARAPVARRHLLMFLAVAVILGIAAWLVAYLYTRRELAERATQRVRARYEELVNNVGAGVFRKATDGNDELLEVNPAMLRIFRAHDREHLVGLSMSDLYADPDLGGELSRTLASTQLASDNEIKMQRLDGEQFWASITAVRKSSASGRSYIDGVLLDITARKQAEEALRASESRFRALLDAAPDAVVITDVAGTIVMVNEQTRALFGYERAELIGECVEKLIPDRFRTRHQAHRREFAQAPRRRPMTHGLDLWGRNKDGVEFPVGVSLSPVQSEQGQFIFSDIRDISERYHAQRRIESLNTELAQHNRELAAVNEELEAFSYSVSHDLRGPLRAIDGFSRLLEDELAGKLDHLTADYLSRVRRAARRMGALIDDLLKLSRVARSELTSTRVDLCALSRDILAQLREQSPQRKIEFDCVGNHCVEGDKQLLRIALENLLSNAWKFSSDRAVAQIEFGLKRNYCDEREVFYVRDNGVGFDMTYRDKLFGAFQRLHDAHEFPGTGIGLATVQRIIHKHGGRIWAEAEENVGATFYFTIDLHTNHRSES